MATWSYQSVCTYNDAGTTWTKASEANSTFQLQDNESGGADALTFEAGDFLDGGVGAGNILYVGYIEIDGITFVIGEDVFSGQYVLYSSVPIQSPSQFPASFDDSAINTGAFTVCFVTGTAIATPNGDCAVEDLAIGDAVLTADGRAVPVRWIGRQTVDARFGPADRLQPVRIAAGALSDCVPDRDLVVSADHGMIVDGMIVHASALVNGTSITRIPVSDIGEQLVYWHVETAGHEVILANGAPAETFIDNVSRRAFDNFAEFAALYGAETAMETALDLPRVTTARQVPERLRHRLAVRAARLISAGAIPA